MTSLKNLKIRFPSKENEESDFELFLKAEQALMDSMGTPEDITYLSVKFHRTYFEEALHLRNGDRILFAELGDALAGYARYSTLERATEFHSLFVYSDFLKRGIGRSLVEYMVEDVRAQGSRKILATIYKDAHPFYKKMGFVQNPRGIGKNDLILTISQS